MGDNLDLTLSEIQLDALREVGNIGAGNAATALSQMMNAKVDMTVPQVDILLFNEMLEKLGSEEEIVVAVLLKVFGDAPGNILFLIEESKSKDFASAMLQGFSSNVEINDEIFMSLFQEIGNILGNSYINAISKLTGLSLITSVPAVAVDMLVAILTTSFMDAEQFSDYVLAIDTNFIDENQNSESGGKFFYIPKPDSLNKILVNLGL